MDTTNPHGSTPAAVEVPWYDLIPDAEPPEDHMQQDDTIMDVMSILRARYSHDPSVLCSGLGIVNIIYDSAVPGSFLAPDGFIVFGVPDSRAIKWDYRSYRIEQWGRSPSFVLEVASESTAANDLGHKRRIYAAMQAQEYWRLDPRAYYYGEPLVGERLVDGVYQCFPLHTEDNGDIWSRSEVLAVDFVFREEGGRGKFFLRDSATGEWLNTLEDELLARQDAESARQAAENRVRELTAELNRLRGQQG